MRVLNAFLLIGTSVVLIAKPDQIIANSHSDVGADCPPVEYRPNGANCDKTCAELPYEHADVWCIEMCLPGYFCKNGYVRKYYKGPCISRSDCPKSNLTSINDAVESETVERTTMSETIQEYKSA